ncbi:MAG: hypothetical protein RMJ43_04730 [Chloroherpetonaceae bacterium]|nr:hypothetical protein [Chthonomonadaceae bacterium]MDW8207119.1 hypothetical protein [Chloroherpetonaceae bacterium]
MALIGITLLLFYARLSTWALGFFIGGTLSLLSLFSLTVIVPFLFQPGVGHTARHLLTLTLFMKLPIYSIGLYAASRGDWCDPRGTGIGIVLAPAVITGYAIRQAFADARAEAEAARQAASRRLVPVAPFPEPAPVQATATRAPIPVLNHRPVHAPPHIQRRAAAQNSTLTPLSKVTPVHEGV